ncbi:PTPRE-like protein, partial [Mya arenaria]
MDHPVNMSMKYARFRTVKRDDREQIAYAAFNDLGRTVRKSAIVTSVITSTDPVHYSQFSVTRDTKGIPALKVFKLTNSESTSTVGGIVGGLMGTLVAVVLVVVVVFIIRRKLNSDKPAKDFSNKPPARSNPGKPDSFEMRNNASNNPTYSNGKKKHIVYELYYSELANGGDYYSFNEAVPGFAIQELWSYIREKMKNNRKHLYDEFATLPTGLVHKHEVAAQEKYKGKNRYKEMYAFHCKDKSIDQLILPHVYINDHSRVPLKKAKPDDPDYINACFIDGYEKVNKFIASQGPTKNMIDDFWRMVWQQKADKIVMLTNLIEMAS